MANPALPGETHTTTRKVLSLEQARKMMRNLLLTLGAISLAACGTVSSVKYSGLQVPAKTSFIFRDERPPEQRSHRVVESNSGSVMIYGDERIAPSTPQLLRASLQEKLGEQLAGKTVLLTTLVVKVADRDIVLDTNQLNTALGSTPGGYAAAPVAVPIIWGIEKMRGHRVVSVEVAGKVDDVPFSSWVSDHYTGSISEENLRTTLTRALETTVFQVMRTQEEGQNQR